MTNPSTASLSLLDCTLRDGGYYNAWDFSAELINDYLLAMAALQVEYVEVGFRSWQSNGFKGGCAYSTDSFVAGLHLPPGLTLGVMMNGSEFVHEPNTLKQRIEHSFRPCSESPVSLVRIACHSHEVEAALPASVWLKDRGYQVGLNLMQIASRTEEQIRGLVRLALDYPLDVLYFADSMGSMSPEDVRHVVDTIRGSWSGALGIHTHDNMGLALENTKAAVESGVTWVDSTVTGMGRGPGNAKTETVVLALEGFRHRKTNLAPLLTAIEKHFRPLQEKFRWGSNPFYFLAGKYGIHPTYIQEMLADTRYTESDILAAIEHLKLDGGKGFSMEALEATRLFYRDTTDGSWSPRNVLEGKTVFVLGAGPSVSRHRSALEDYVRQRRPVVIALNANESVDNDLVDFRAVCHPIRLMADCSKLADLGQPLVTPAGMLPDDVRQGLGNCEVLDFGLAVQPDTFEFYERRVVQPNALALSYVLGVATSGGASEIALAGFDGYTADDPRRAEVESVFETYKAHDRACPIVSLTQTLYEVPVSSVYALID